MSINRILTELWRLKLGGLVIMPHCVVLNVSENYIVGFKLEH